MRVLYDHQIFSIQSRGGISRYFLELSSRLALHGAAEPLISAGWHRSEMLREAAPPWIRGWYIRHVPKTRPLRLALNAYFTRQQVRRWRPDIVHETYFRKGPAHMQGTKTVLTVYDLIYFVLPDAHPEAARIRDAQIAAITRADHVICISETTRNDLLRFIPIDPQSVSVTPLAAQAPAPNSSGSARPDVDGPFILYVGLRNSYKNFDGLLQAFALSPILNSRYRLVAFGGGAFTDAEIVRQRSLGIDPSRVIHRTGNDSVLEQYYAHASSFVCSSFYEGFGLPPVEAMARGCPVVCSNRGSLPEVTGDAALLVDPSQPSEFAHALEAISNSPSLSARMRASGLRQAAVFSWERCANETLAIYGNSGIGSPR